MCVTKNDAHEINFFKDWPGGLPKSARKIQVRPDQLKAFLRTQKTVVFVDYRLHF